MKKNHLFILLCLVLSFNHNRVEAQSEKSWVNARMEEMTLEEKVGQLFMVAAYSNKSPTHKEAITKLVEDHHIGGLIFFQGGPIRQINLTNHFQSRAKIPLLIGMDAEWGVAMRLDSVEPLPMPINLGATWDPNLAKQYGDVVADQCNALGIHVNFAPVIDVNSNPDNPVIGVRSFGENKQLVQELGLAYMQGLQDKGVMACAKHFPGHGDTDMDSHKTLPKITHDADRVDSIDLAPFKALIAQGVQSVMMAHLDVPAITGKAGLPSSLSDKAIKDWLRNRMGFRGLVFTDALNMKGVSDQFEPGALEVRALKAGNDVLLFSQDVPTAKKAIIQAIETGELTEQEIEQKVHKILAAKYKAGLSHFEPIESKGIYKKLNSTKAELINRQVVEQAITLLQNKDDLLPLKRLDTLRIGLISIGGAVDDQFKKGIERYASVEEYTSLGMRFDDSVILAIEKQMDNCNLILIGLHGTRFQQENNYGINHHAVKLAYHFSREMPTIVNVFANPYSLNRIFGMRHAKGVILGYGDTKWAQDYISQLIFGGISASGKLPVTASTRYELGDGLTTGKPIRFKYTIPEDISISGETLSKIDKIANKGIQEKAFPGCQILVAKDGNVIFNKGFGHHKYDKERPVRTTDIYDLASVTKVAASTISVMKLVDQGKISIDSTLDTYLNDLVDSTAYKTLIVRHIMAHQAGLFPWIPFYLKTIKDGQPDPAVFATKPDSTHTERVAENLYISKEYRNVILNRIVNTKVSWRKKYKYSDMGFYLIQEIIERITDLGLDQYAHQNFYEPLGATTVTYQPRKKFGLDRIVPTEDDTIFRKQLLIGDVHDQGAALLGGVAGHAGLFSNSNDLAKIMQMLANYGTYGGQRYISDSTIKDFTKCQFCGNNNRRGAGFDKPVRNNGPGPTCHCVSYSSFGHTGFTGITAWSDPVENVVYIFLSNQGLSGSG